MKRNITMQTWSNLTYEAIDKYACIFTECLIYKQEHLVNIHAYLPNASHSSKIKLSSFFPFGESVFRWICKMPNFSPILEKWSDLRSKLFSYIWRGSKNLKPNKHLSLGISHPYFCFLEKKFLGTCHVSTKMWKSWPHFFFFWRKQEKCHWWNVRPNIRTWPDSFLTQVCSSGF